MKLLGEVQKVSQQDMEINNKYEDENSDVTQSDTKRKKQAIKEQPCAKRKKNSN